MKTLIEGGWVVAWNGTRHEVYERGAVVYEGDRVVHAGGPYAGAVDARVSARGKLVSPGFINTHVHTTGNGGDWMLGDMVKNDHRTSNYLAFAAPLKGKLTPPPPEAVAALRAYVFLHALKNGSTTIIDVGGLRGDWEGYARLVDDLGVRVYASPPFRDRNTFTDERGRLYYDTDAAAGAKQLDEAIGFVKAYDGTAQGRLRGMLNAAQVETCSESLLRAGKAAARDLGVPIHTHAGGNLLEFQRIMDEHRKTPIQFLADIGFLDHRTLIGHGVFTTAHPWTLYPFGDDVRVLAETGATVGHCPYKYAKMAMTLHSFQRYLDAGVQMAMGTDTFPMDMVAELRWASILTRVTDRNYQAGQSRDVYNAATLGACRFIERPDLGRLAPGSKADIVLINLDHMGTGAYTDPIKALVDAGTGRDVDTVIVDGATLVENGRAARVDEAAIDEQARKATQRYWQHVPGWHWAGCDVDQIVPPAFPIHRAGLELDLARHLEDAPGGQAEEPARPGGVPRHEGEELVPPQRHSRARRGDDGLRAQDVDRGARVDRDALPPALRHRARDMGLLEKAVARDHPEAALAQGLDGEALVGVDPRDALGEHGEEHHALVERVEPLQEPAHRGGDPLRMPRHVDPRARHPHGPAGLEARGRAPRR